MRLRRWSYLCLVGMFALLLVVFALQFTLAEAVDDGDIADEPAMVTSIIGSDDRFRIFNTTGDPYRKIALLETTFPSSTITSCTGWFISPDSVVTAGHCVYRSSFGGWAESVKVIPGINDSVLPYGWQTSTTFFAPEAWSTDELAEYDYAVVRLPDTTLGDQTGYFEYGYYSDDYFDTMFQTYLAGYPLDKTYATMWMGIDYHGGVDEGILSYPMDTFAGQSGSPVWRTSGLHNVVIGIHTRGETSLSCAEGMNCGARITPDVAANLQLWGVAQLPQTDCLTLNTGVAPLASGSVFRTPVSSAGCQDSAYVKDYEWAHSVVTLEAIPESGYLFLGWTGVITETSNPITVAMTSEITMTATFTEVLSGPISMDAFYVDDDSSGDSDGNSDGIPNCGERLELDLALRNAGYGQAVGVTTTVTSSHALVNIVESNAVIGDIDAMDVVTTSGIFVIEIDESYEGTTQAGLLFTFTDDEGASWQDSAVLDMVCPEHNEAPYSPNSPSPVNDAQDEQVSVVLSWSGGDPDGDLVTYDIYFEADDTTPDRLVCDDVTKAECNVGTLDYSTIYTWQVIARDPLGAIVVGDYWNFTTMLDNDPPHVPTNPSPNNGSVEQLLDLTLTWTGGDPDGDAVTYDVHFDEGPDMPVTKVYTNVLDTQCTVSNLKRGTQYGWYVVARDAHGATSTSGTWVFTTHDTRTLYMPFVVRD